jgi:HEAT repeat protein
MTRRGLVVTAAWLVLAAACRPPASTLGTSVGAAELRREAVATLRELLVSGEPEAQVQAIRVAERFDVAALFDPVTRLLDADDERVRAAAAAATLRAHPDAPGVLRAMLRARSPAARRLAVAALGRRVGEPAAAELGAALGDPDPSVRAAAIDAGATFHRVARLLQLAAEDPDGAVRARALAALGQRRAAEGRAVATAGLADPDLAARLAAAQALHAIAGRGATAELTSAKDPFVRLRAAQLLGGDRAAALRAAASGSEPALRAAAGNAVTTELEVARLLARDDQPMVRLAGGRALLRAGQPAEARVVLGRLLGTGDPTTRIGAAAELATAGEERGAAVLSELAGDPDPAVRAATMRALPRRGRIPDVIRGALLDPAAEVRLAAAEVALERLA